jgi:hypothetical protein
MKIEESGSASGSESGSIGQRHGSADPDPHQNVMDPQHWIPEMNTHVSFQPSNGAQSSFVDPDPYPDTQSGSRRAK